MTRITTSGLLLAVCVLGCERKAPQLDAEYRSPAPAGSRSTRETAVARPPVPTCVVPLPASAPPEAEPATDCPPDPGPVPELPRGSVRFTDAPGRPQVDVELAKTPEHRQRGLMYRTELGADAGMLFSWPNEARRSFWMRNTCLPLDMLFITADGAIAGVLEQVPTMNEAPRGVRCRVAHVLEVNAGYVRAHGVEPGQHVDISP